MNFNPLYDLFQQMRPGFRRPFLLVWYALVIAGALKGTMDKSFESPVVMMCFTLAGSVVVVVAFGILFSSLFRKAILTLGYSLAGHRILLFIAGTAGLFIAAGAAMMLIGM